jgi:FixJ family two-component response regulator
MRVGVTQRQATVVVVDDDLSVRRSLERLLRSAGHRVETFASAREFLARSDADRAACLVLDVTMPGQSGLDLHGMLLAGGDETPVIFITGHSDFPIADRAMKACAVDFLSKPFSGDRLLHAVERAIAKDRRWRP